MAQQQLNNLANVKNSYAGFKYWGEKFPDNIFYTESGFEKLALPEIKRLAKTEDLKSQWVNLYQADYKISWVNYLAGLKPELGNKYTPGKIQKLLITARKNIFYENMNLTQYYKNLVFIASRVDQKYLDQLVELANTAVLSITDLKTRAAIQNVLYLPLRERYAAILNKNLENINTQWRAQIAAIYTPKIFLKYPFLNNTLEEVNIDEFNYFFEPNQGIGPNFMSRNIFPYFSSHWLGITPHFSPDFLKFYNQVGYITNNFNFEIYPEPTVGLKEIRIIMNNQNYKYRNDPQEWQGMRWQLNSTEPQTAIQIITATGSMGSLEAPGPWGLFKLLQKAELTRMNNNLFKARWKIKADNGRVYSVNLLFKNPKENNFLNIILFDKFKLPSEVFIVYL